MANLLGYVDDSGSGEGKDRGNIFLLAGFVACPKQWQRFSIKWENICNHEPKTPDFKMQKAIRLLRPNGTRIWTEKQRDRRIRKLVRLTKRTALFRVESVTAWPNYDLVAKSHVPSQFDSPYFLCFYNVILSVAAFMDKARIDGVVDWVFDDQGRIGKEALKWYKFVRANVSDQVRARMGLTPTFGHDKDILPLKAADLYAWQIRRHLDKEVPNKIAHNDHLDILAAQVYGVSSVIEGEHMEEFVANIGNGLMLKSRTGYLLPSHSRIVRIVARARKWL